MYSKKIFQFIEENELINDHDQLLIAVSGGPDSMCLLHFLILYKSLQKKKNIKLYVAHVNHHTRGEENDLEESLIRRYCEENQVEFFRADFYYSGKDNFHHEARNFRYDFFIKIAKQYKLNKIVLAHHKDDQVETILFKVIRGNNIFGYTGMDSKYSYHDHSIIRPFLGITKQDILKYCQEYIIPYAVDSSNESNKYTRNKLRNIILPELKEIQSDINDKLIQFETQMHEVNEFIYKHAFMAYSKCVTNKVNNEIELDCVQLMGYDRAIIRLVITMAINEVTKDSLSLTFEKINNIMGIIDSDKPNITYDIGNNYFCIKSYNSLKFTLNKPEQDDYTIFINEFKDYKLSNGMIITVKKMEEKAKINNKSLILCYNSTMWPLLLRTRKNGDLIKTSIGHKKINRIFIDAKIPTILRDSWPILTDRNGTIIWVVGLQKAEIEFTDECKQYIYIDVSKTEV
jgi:tRNA(Ile)-lysidine synthase